MGKFGKIAFNIFTALCVIGVLASLTLAILGIKPYVVISGSMEPAIHTGSICLVDTNAGYGDIKEGDIIAFSKGSGLPVTHRVVGAGPQGLETKGDANPVPDGIVTTEKNYMGKTVLTIPYMGYALSDLQTKRGKILALTFLAAACIAGALLKDTDSEKDLQEELL